MLESRVAALQRGLNLSREDSQYLSIPYFAVSSNWLFSGWFNLRRDAPNPGEFTYIENFTDPGGPGWTLYRYLSGDSVKLRFYINGTLAFELDESSVEIAQDYLLQVRKTGTTLQAWVNNVSLGTATYEGAWSDVPTGTVVIGRRTATEGRFIDGVVRHLGFWNSAKDDTFRQGLWNNGLGRPFDAEDTDDTDDAAFLLNCDDAVGATQAADISGNARHGSLPNGGDFGIWQANKNLWPDYDQMALLARIGQWPTVALTDNTTLTAEDSQKIFTLTGTGKTLTIPTTAGLLCQVLVSSDPWTLTGYSTDPGINVNGQLTGSSSITLPANSISTIFNDSAGLTYIIAPHKISELKTQLDGLCLYADVAATENVELSGLPDSINGVNITGSSNVGTRFLLWKQTDPVENGIYVYTFDESVPALTRAGDFAPGQTMLAGQLVICRAGEDGVTAQVFKLSKKVATVDDTGQDVVFVRLVDGDYSFLTSPNGHRWEVQDDGSLLDLDAA